MYTANLVINMAKYYIHKCKYFIKKKFLFFQIGIIKTVKFWTNKKQLKPLKLGLIWNIRAFFMLLYIIFCNVLYLLSIIYIYDIKTSYTNNKLGGRGIIQNKTRNNYYIPPQKNWKSWWSASLKKNFTFSWTTFFLLKAIFLLSKLWWPKIARSTFCRLKKRR